MYGTKWILKLKRRSYEEGKERTRSSGHCVSDLAGAGGPEASVKPSGQHGGIANLARCIVQLQIERQCQGGCPIGSFASEMAEMEPEARTELASEFMQWELAIRRGLRAMYEAKEYEVVSTVLMIFCMTFITFLLYITTHETASLFTLNEVVLSLISFVIRIDVISQLATASVAILTTTLQAGGDTKFSMRVTAIGIWFIRTLGVYIVGALLGWRLPSVWWMIALNNYVRAILLWRRFQSNSWVKLKG
jgi:hypothetical protein